MVAKFQIRFTLSTRKGFGIINKKQRMKYVLASASPRRRELFSLIVPEFDVQPSGSEEKFNMSLFPEHVACSVAESKCDEVFLKNSEATVVGCDTIVVFEGEILGKPRNAEEATRTLKRLSGKTHFVITAVCIRNKRKKLIDFEKTEVRFNDLSDEFIRIYVDSGSPLDKAGGYGIQDGGFVKEYFGSYTNVVGLPVTLVKKMLDEVLQ